MNWLEIFDYDGQNLIWKRPYSRKVKAGDVAGCVNKNGYIQVSVMNKLYLAHRVVWEMHNGDIPDGMQIDHINHDRIDNRIDNLRIVTNRVNSINSSIGANNRSGFNGVSWMRSKNKWRSRIMIHGVEVSLGLFDCFDDAVTARLEANEKYGFHENHGK